MEIRKYNESKDFEKMVLLFESEEDWNCYSGKDSIGRYKEALRKSISYVAYSDDKLAGYSRSIDDFGFYIYVCDLLVNKDFRGNSIGKQLMECLLKDFPNQEVYVMSDVDLYYKKLGYEIEGSIFKVKSSI